MQCYDNTHKIIKAMAMYNGLKIIQFHPSISVFSASRAFLKGGTDVYEQGCINSKKPQRPLTPFAKFVLQRKDEIWKLKSTSDIKGKFLQTASRLWTAAPQSEKQKLLTEYKSELNNYNNEIQKWKLSLLKAEAEEKKSGVINLGRGSNMCIKEEAKLLCKPKRPIPPHFVYVQEQMKKLNDRDPKLFRNLLKDWSLLPTTEKQKYISNYKNEYEKYSQDLLQWENEMLKLGFDRLVRQTTLKSKHDS